MQAMCPVREKKKRIKPKAWFSSFRNLKDSCEKKHLFIILLLRLLDKIKGLRNGYNIKTSFFSQDITTVSLPPTPKWEIIIKDTKEKGFWRKGPLWCVS